MANKNTDQTDQTDLIAQVRTRLGETRFTALGTQPLAMAAGGIEAVLQQACAECAGFPNPLSAATVRTLQLCGSHATPEDLA